MLPGLLGTSLQLVDRHARRLEHHMLTVVELPVPRQDPAFALEPLIERRAGKRRHDGETREIYLGIYRKTRGLEEDVRRVMIHPEYEAAVYGDSVCMEQ